ncbi:hypothetical protein NUACC21_24430 [Scytonema sp. NUACC21]
MNTSSLISVIIPTHNPNLIRLERVLDALRKQQLPHSCWELLIVDNASDNPQIFSSLELLWHPTARVIREENLGLTRARLAGIEASQGNYLVFVDDDNILHPEYLTQINLIFQQNPKLGAIGGKSLPEFEVQFTGD